MALIVPIYQVLIILFLAGHHDSWRAYLSFTAFGVGLFAGPDMHFQSPVSIPVDTLSLQQRYAAAGLAALCATCNALVLSHLYRLFGLYCRGVVFSQANILRIKGFAMWLVAAAVATNISGRLFVRVTGINAESTANAALAVIFGAMIYVIAHVMELARQADLERKDFV
ncbi:MAG TPA: hypothetical protein VGV09_18700 [Steroidobacteraceae bacterium]|nr:hypothetical protein [Steroidobacteraceae bacterium]